MSLLPSWVEELENASEPTASTTRTIPKEYGIDFATGRMTGKTVSSKEAIKVWAWNCLKTERYKYGIFSDQYGVEMAQYIGHVPEQEFIQTDIQQDITDALMQNPYITAVNDFNLDFSGSKITISLAIETIYGNVDITGEEI